MYNKYSRLTEIHHQHFASNINLGGDAVKIANSISVIQANGNARAALMVAKKEVTEQPHNEKIERPSAERKENAEDTGDCCQIKNLTPCDVESARPPKKPPRQTDGSQTDRERERELPETEKRNHEDTFLEYQRFGVQWEM
jgi:hypothetical protein